MERVEKFLKDFGEMILDEIEEIEATKHMSDVELANIKQMCIDYNIMYKFAEHHHELECGFLHMHKDTSIGATIAR